MNKVIDFNKPIKSICDENPEVITIMKDCGFEQITNPMMLKTVGRFMTIKKGAEMKKININEIKDKFRSFGYEVVE